MISVYREALRTMSHIESVTHKFLVKGHTQNEGDSVHATIEKQVKRTLKSGPIFLPSQYITAIACAKRNSNPYKVIEMCHKDFLELKNLPGHNVVGMKITEVCAYKVTKDEKRVFFKTSYGEDIFDEAEEKVEEARTRKSSKKEKLVYFYKSKLPINAKKKAGLLELLNKGLIPKVYSSFYHSL